MHVTKQINYCLPASSRPAHVSWVNLAFAAQQPDDKDSQQSLVQSQPGDTDLIYSFREAMILPATYLTHYRLTAN